MWGFISQIFPYVVIAILMFMLISRPVVTNTIEIPAKSGSFIVDKPEPVVVYDTIYKDNIIEKLVVKENPVNQELLEKYNQATDSLSKLILYRDAITIRDYKQVFKDMNQEITILSKVTGTLESQEVAYDIHSTSIKYKAPSEGLYIGVGTSASYQQIELPSLDVYFSYIKNKRIYSLGTGTDQRIKINIQQKIF